MMFSIIIPVLYSDTLSKTIQAIQAQTSFERITEILIVGRQKSINLPSSRFRYLNVNENPNVTHNRNVGLKEAKGEWICFTDSDCIPDMKWVENFLPYILQGFKAIGGAVDIPESMSYWGRCHHYHSFQNQAYGLAKKTFLTYAATLNFCIHRETLISLGGFNEALEIGGEDRELSLRLQNSNIHIAFSPEAIVTHNHPRKELKAAWLHSYQFGQNTASARMLHKNTNSYYWQWFPKIIKVPIAGEIIVFLRALANVLLRFFIDPAYFKLLLYLPGIFLLDIALGTGMIHLIRLKWTTPR